MWQIESSLNKNSHKVLSTYSILKNVRDDFKKICATEGRCASKMIELLMTRYLKTKS